PLPGAADMNLGRCLITVGNGYLGRALAAELARRGADVVRLDTREAPGPVPGRFVGGDISDRAAVIDATRGVDTIFHAASVIDLATNGTRRQRTLSYQVNVRGTRNVIDACRIHEIRRLVYTSSSTVVFDGRPHAEVTEEMPYPTRDLSLYLTTKALAERAVLAADEPGLATCAVRPGGIFGPGEQHHLPRLAREIARGRFIVLFGQGNARSEWSFIDNLVH